MSKLIKSASALIVITMVSKIFGFLREIFIGSSYGITKYADAYITASNIPIIIFTSISSAIAISFIPIYTEINEKKGVEEADKFTNNLINIIIVLCTILMIICLIFTKQIVKLFAVGFDKDILELTVSFTRIVIVGIIFMGVSNVLTGYLQIKSKFAIAGAIGIPYSIIVILFVKLSVMYGDIYILVWGTLLAIASQLLIQLPSAIKSGYRYKLNFKINDDNIKKLVILIIPVLIGAGVSQINTIIDRSLASTLGTGTVSAFNYANKLYSFIQGMFIVSLVSIIYPSMASYASKDDTEGFIKSTVKGINTMSLIILPVTVGTIVLSEPVVRVLFERGEFTPKATIMTSSILALYAIGTIAYALRDVITRSFYSLKDTKTPMINGSISIVINIILNIILIKYMGYRGLALASTIAAFVGIVLLFISLNKKIGHIGIKSSISVILKSLIASIIMGIIVNVSYKMINSKLNIEVIALFGSIVTGVLVYSVIISFMKIDEVKFILDNIKSKINK